MVARYLLKKRKQRRIHLLEFLACDSSVGRAVDCKQLAYFFLQTSASQHAKRNEINDDDDDDDEIGSGIIRL